MNQVRNFTIQFSQSE